MSIFRWLWDNFDDKDNPYAYVLLGVSVSMGILIIWAVSQR